MTYYERLHSALCSARRAQRIILSLTPSLTHGLTPGAATTHYVARYIMSPPLRYVIVTTATLCTTLQLTTKHGILGHHR